MRTKTKAYLSSDEIDPETLLISKKGVVFTVQRRPDKVVPVVAETPPRFSVIKKVSEEEKQKHKRKPKVKIIVSYDVMQYYKGAPMPSSLVLTPEQLRAQGVKVLRYPEKRKRGKGSLASKSLKWLTGSRQLVLTTK